MRIYGMSVLIFAVFGAPIPSVPNKDKAKIDKNLLQGKWELAKVEICGKTYLPEQMGGAVFVSKDGEIVVCKTTIEAFMKLRYFPLYGVGINKNMVFSGEKCDGTCEIDGQILSGGRTKYKIDVSRNPRTCEIDGQILSGGGTKYKIDVSRNPRRIIFLSDEDDSLDPPDYPEPLYIYSVSKDELRLCFGIGEYPADFKTHKNKKICLTIYKRAEK
jgi:hypothetical protein